MIDSSDVGDGCTAWMISVIYRKRALPLVWFVKRVKKGHASDDEHLALLQAVKAILPEGQRRVIVEKLGRYNSTAHPSKVEITQVQAEDFITDLVNNIVLKLA